MNSKRRRINKSQDYIESTPDDQLEQPEELDHEKASQNKQKSSKASSSQDQLDENVESGIIRFVRLVRFNNNCNDNV